ncbi:putative leucine-rich repeat-containing protein DDB_G0290503 isoform X2 [Bradysia coprophila]|uniref:putative leucine-rich repeat-containing protein DDB_G0290503 isoform X2 n=1 Tax=Bradysia coprophila TaxID=38358 RepID=UPI00187D7722|nr:putative leucine-rich repeat-containing protein DDB_G0290503 isoform X2 [Bradysia coprophila]
MENSPDEILKRLEELRSWQGMQQQKLLSKQLTRSQICTLEQQKLCEMFGLSTLTSTISDLNLSDLNEKRPQTPPVESAAQQNTSLPEDQLIGQNDTYASNVVGTPQKCFLVETPIDNFSLDELDAFGKETEDQLDADFEDKPKKSFLKRGQGLTARFKIRPEQLRIENLPKYKFANSHKRSKFFRDHKQPVDGHRLDQVPKSKQMVNDSKPADLRSVANKKPSSATWANVLELEQKNVVTKPTPKDNLFNTPTMAEKTQKQHQDQRDLQIFELLEQNLNNSAILQNTDVMKQLVQYMLTAQSSLQCNAQQELNFDKSAVDVTTDNVEAKRNVRFAIEPTDRTRENEDSECETIASTDIEEMDHSKTSTPITKTQFELFKQNLFAESDSTLVDKYCKDNTMKLRNEELKERLTELQNEIELFRQQNATLTQSMREHEVEKLLWEEQKNEMLEKIEDERIRQEVYLHDERMKLIDEQKKLDKRMKEVRAPNRKDKEDMAKLKQDCADLQKELANKDQKHIGAQARLRAQIRNMEKDLKEFSLEIDNLRKENKKIESENVRLRRQNNNKMLNEINKNIAKLAPKLDTQAVIDRTDSNKNSQSAAETKSQSDIQSKSKGAPNLIRVKEIPKTCGTDDSDDTDTDTSSSTPKRSSYFKDSQRSKLTKETNATPSDDIPMLESNSSSSLKREIVNDDGSRDIWYPNGNLKKVSADEMVIRMLYFNKDVKETNIHEGTVKYYYAEANTWQTTYLDGLEIWEFPNGRNEHHYKDGRIEAHHPDGSICTTNPNDMETAEEWKYLNGTTFVIKRNGDKYLSLPNGQREVTTKNHIRREYPDGTVKIKYPDGSLETRYSNGRVRLRDAAGTLIRDSEPQ